MKIVPKKKRFEVYNKALVAIESPNPMGFTFGDKCLCMLLIMLHTPKKYPDTASTKLDWMVTPSRFPEFAKYYDANGHHIEYSPLYESNRKEWRIKILKEIIAKG